MPKLQGYKNDVVAKRAAFEAIKLNGLQLFEPVSKTLQESSFLTPKLLSVCRNGIKVLKKFLHLLNRDGSDAFHRDDIFKTASEILKQISVEREDIVPECQTRAAVVENPNSNFCNFHEYFLKGDLETAMEVNCKEVNHIIASLIEALKTQLQPLLENDIFKVISITLDSKSYKFLNVDIIYDEVKVIEGDFKDVLLTNNYHIDHLKEELEILFDHINRYVSKSS